MQEFFNDMPNNYQYKYTSCEHKIHEFCAKYLDKSTYMLYLSFGLNIDNGTD